MSERGFNLFTALISFLLIIIAGLLATSMTAGERNVADMVAEQHSMSELQAVADTARADAMQVFNYSLRKTIEEWVTDPERGKITLQLHDVTWDEIKNAYVEDKFGGKDGVQFAEYTANSLSSLFYSGAQFGDYEISVDQNWEFRNILKKAIEDSVNQGDFFEVIGCENGIPRDCELGTFYVNLHLERLENAEYENLPRIVVEDKGTGEKIKQVILPKSVFRIYVPLRVFKAIAYAKAYAHTPNQENTGGDYGLFSPKNHNTTEEMALGICDYDYCAPRNNPFQPPELRIWGGDEVDNPQCPGDPLKKEMAVEVEIECPAGAKWCESVKAEYGKYNAASNSPAEIESMSNVLKKLAENKICDAANYAFAYSTIPVQEDFKVIGDEGCGKINKLRVVTSAQKSKAIVSEGDAKKVGSGYYGSDLNPNTCNWDTSFGTSNGRRVGVYMGNGEIKFPQISNALLSCDTTGVPATANYAYCTEVKNVEMNLLFEENNNLYKVSNKDAPLYYNIALYDNYFTPFTAKWDAGNGVNNLCLYNNSPNEQNCSFAKGKGWYCISKQGMREISIWDVFGINPAEVPYKSIGCYPG